MDHAEIFSRMLRHGEITEAEESALADRMVDALKLYDRHRQLGLEMQAANGDELETLDAVRRYLAETAIPPWMIMPIWLRIAELRSTQVRTDSASLPERKLMPLTFCAAAVSAYAELGLRKVSDAAGHAAKLSGREATRILDFRENTKRADKETPRKVAYHQMLRQLKAIPPAGFDAQVSEMLAQLAAIPTEE